MCVVHQLAVSSAAAVASSGCSAARFDAAVHTDCAIADMDYDRVGTSGISPGVKLAPSVRAQCRET